MIVLGLLALLSFGAIEAGSYNIDELRNIVYEFDIDDESLIDPSLDLDSVNSENIDEFRRKVLANYPSADDPSNTFITTSKGGRIVCSVPKETENVGKKEERLLDSYNPKYVAELIAANFYVEKCIELENGWWKYELCTGSSIRQFHGTKNEADWVENTLGWFVGRYSLPDYEKLATDRQLYFEESYEGGTLCDVKDNNVRRKTIVRYECDPVLATFEAKLEQVEETSSCEYLMRVKVGSLCRLKAFLPPMKETAVKITCKSCLAIEKIYKYLEIKARVNDIKANARAQYARLLEYQKSLERIRRAFLRTKLEREWKKNEKILEELNDEYAIATEDLLYHAHQVEYGEIPSADKLATLMELDNLVHDLNFPLHGYAEYPTDLDEDRGNIWFYFKDPLWDKKYYPFTLSYVWVCNEYRLRVKRQFFPANSWDGDPFKYDENVLLKYHELHPYILNDMEMRDSFIPVQTGIFYHHSMEKFAQKGKLFGLHEREILLLFIAETKLGFSYGLEVEDWYLQSKMARTLAPSYLVVQLFLASGHEGEFSKSLVEKELAQVTENAALMLDKMISAYHYAEMQFDLENENVELSFGGKWRALGVKAGRTFESVYNETIGARDASVHEKMIEDHKQVMTRYIRMYHRLYFRQAWTLLKDDFFRRGLKKDKAERARKPAPVTLPNIGSSSSSSSSEKGVEQTEYATITLEMIEKSMVAAVLGDDAFEVELLKLNKAQQVNLIDFLHTVARDAGEKSRKAERTSEQILNDIFAEYEEYEEKKERFGW